MVAVLVLATFAIFVLVDYYFQRRAPRRIEMVPAVEPHDEAGFPINVIGGFKLPAHLSYHPGHTWAMKEAPGVVRIGLDDFAARLVGKVDVIELPARRHWLRQGEKGWTITRGSHRFQMLAPMEGEVIDVNMEALENPGLVHEDPFGAGWLLEVHAPAAEGNMKNLLRGRLAQRWMEESVAALQSKIDGRAGVYLQDGGHAVPDVLKQVPEERWDSLLREFFLS
jgi:glycine cleavage system H lipoate-binding protein